MGYPCTIAMDIELWMDSLSRTPQWVFLILLPALLAGAAPLFALTKARRAYPVFAAGLIGAGAALAACVSGARAAAAVAGMELALAALCGVCFVKRKRADREEKMYRKFREGLRNDCAPAASASPPKVCCFERTPVASPEECGMRLSHAEEMLGKLKKASLSAADRLEAEALTHTMEGYRGRALTEEELRGLNDCLASVLRMTAKYKL